MMQVVLNNESCQDRAAMALNEIYTSWKIMSLGERTSIKEKLDLLESCAKTLALRSALSSFIDSHQKEKQNIERESVEIYLYYETSLKQKLKLLSAIDQMSYEHMGKRDWIQEAALITKVDSSYKDHLVDLPQLQAIAEADESFKESWKSQEDLFIKQMEELESNYPQDTDESSASFLDHQSKFGELGEKKNEAYRKALKDWLEKTKGKI